MFPSRKCAMPKSSIVRIPLVGLIAKASNAAGTTEITGPRLGMKVNNAAMKPSVPARGTWSAQRPTAMKTPIESMEMAFAKSHDCSNCVALAKHRSNRSRWATGVR